MSATTSVIMQKALDGLVLRQTAIAQNIADATSRTPRRAEVAFETQLRAAAQHGDAAVSRLDIAVTSAPRHGFGDETRVDLELADAAETGLRYNALLDLLGRQLQIARLAAQSER